MACLNQLVPGLSLQKPSKCSSYWYSNTSPSLEDPVSFESSVGNNNEISTLAQINHTLHHNKHNTPRQTPVGILTQYWTTPIDFNHLSHSKIKWGFYQTINPNRPYLTLRYLYAFKSFKQHINRNISIFWIQQKWIQPKRICRYFSIIFLMKTMAKKEI
jgi:hypothetical protein